MCHAIGSVAILLPTGSGQPSLLAFHTTTIHPTTASWGGGAATARPRRVSPTATMLT